MKLALLNSYYYPEERGGAERSVRILAEGLVKLGHQVTIITLAISKSESVQEHNGVRIVRLPIRNAYLPNEVGGDVGAASRLVWHARDSYNLSAQNDIARALRQSGVQLLHSNNISGFSVSAWSAARALGLPVVHTIRDFYLQCPRTTMMKEQHACMRSCVSCKPFALPRRFASSGVQHVIGISRFMLERHLNNGYFDGVPSSVIYNSFDGPEKLELRAPGDEFVIGFIGRLVPEKGIELLLHAFRKLHMEGRQGRLRLVIAGDGQPEYLANLKLQALNLPIEFLGKIDTRDFFPRVDLTVVPSVWNEPLGRVVIESMAFAKPVVVTPVGGMPELIKSDVGIVLRSPTVDALYEGLMSLLPQLRVGYNNWSAAAQKASKAYGSINISQRYAEVFERYVR